MKGEGIFVVLIDGGSKTTSWAAPRFDRLAAKIGGGGWAGSRKSVLALIKPLLEYTGKLGAVS